MYYVIRGNLIQNYYDSLMMIDNAKYNAKIKIYLRDLISTKLYIF